MVKQFILAGLTLCAGALAQSPAPVTNPVPKGSIQPNWSTAADGSAFLSWVAPGNAGAYTLQYAMRRGSQWSEVRTIASNRRFFRHPAELPELLSLADGTLVAHWVETGAQEGEAEYIFASTSRDGIHWSSPLMAHHDKSAVQHGLASIVASGRSEASIFWLQALKGEDGPVSLMRTVIANDGREIREEEIDKDVCSCCPTSAVRTASGLLVAYRAHTPQDIRDIAVRRLDGGQWSPLKILNPDKWRINACPVNAAVASAAGDRVAIAWYTAADSAPRVQIAFSSDNGRTFSKPVKVNTARSSGYASVALNEDGRALVSWIEDGVKSSRLLVRLASPAASDAPVQIAQGARQDLGYPRLARIRGENWIAWGEANGAVRTALLK